MTPRAKPIRLAIALIALICLAGCATTRLTLSDHPLADRIWDVTQQRFISAQEAEDRVAAADIALLGETHDNPAHHHIQARLLRQAVAHGKRPALALEQIDAEWQAAVDAARAAAGATSNTIAQAGHISAGWEWPFYRPLVVQALRARLPIIAANLSRPRARKLAAKGLAALGDEAIEDLALDQPWTARQNATLRQLLVEGHCGEDDPMIDKLIHVQRTRDATMADKLLDSPVSVVAIMGRSHARADVGVPLYLRERAPDKGLLSLGLVEVETGKQNPADYADAAPGLHDLVWFTPRARRSDPCANVQQTGR